jgi:hypothetical protein
MRISRWFVQVCALIADSKSAVKRTVKGGRFVKSMLICFRALRYPFSLLDVGFDVQACATIAAGKGVGGFVKSI